MNQAHLRIYVAFLLASSGALAVSWTYWYGLELELRFALGAAVFACFIFVADLLPLRVSDRYTIGVWDVGLIVAIVVLGPTWAALAALPSAFLVGRNNWIRTAYELGHSVIVVYLGGIVFSFASDPLLAGGTKTGHSGFLWHARNWSSTAYHQQSDQRRFCSTSGTGNRCAKLGKS